MDDNERQGPPEQPIQPTTPCPDCGQSFKTNQGLAGHWRLAHSNSTRRALDEHRRALDQQSVELKRREGAARRAETEAARRERAARDIEETPESERIGRIVAREIASLPEVTEETILRVNGRDYRIEDGRLTHLYFPDGEKTDFEDGQWFQFGGRAYCVRDGNLRSVRPSAILAEFLDEEE
jgi:hypothetical protein